MGFGSLIGSGAQNSLTNLQTGVNLLGAQMQQSAANTQAAAYKAQATNVMQQTGLSAEQATIQTAQTLGEQAQGYAQGGVEQTGSPLLVLNQTRLLGEQQVSAIVQQGTLQANMLNTQADLVQQQGLADLLSAQGQNQITQQENQMKQAQQKNQVLQEILSPLASLGVGLLGLI